MKCQKESPNSITLASKNPKMISSNGDTSMTQAVVFNNASCNSCHGNNFDGRNQPHITFK